MPRRRLLNGVLDNLLDLLVSRYTDYDGYWLFGLLTSEHKPIKLSLIRPQGTLQHPVEHYLEHLAHAKFEHLLLRSGLLASHVTAAGLVLTRSETQVNRIAGQHVRWGYMMTLEAWASSDLGRTYRRKRGVFVSPHDPRFEHRSTRRLQRAYNPAP